MSLFLPYQHVARNIHLLVEQVGVPRSDVSKDNTKQLYAAVLNGFQPYTLPEEDTCVVRYVPQESIVNALVQSGQVLPESAQSDSLAMNERQRTQTKKLFKEGVAHLQSIDRAAFEYTNLLIHEVFCCNVRESGGGSIVQNLGLVWFSPKKHWTVEYVAENLYHEALHQALFLEDMIQGVFGESEILNNEKYGVTSNFLHVTRPFDMAFHGVFVAAELMHFYTQHGDKEKASSFIKELRVSLSEMDDALANAAKDNVALLTERGEDLYNNVRTYVLSTES